MNVQDFEYLKTHLETSELLGCDTSIANLFLLQKKYNTELKIYNNVLYRYYYGTDNRSGYGFPLALKNSPENWLKIALEYIYKDSNEKKRPFQFCLVSQSQKSQLTDCLNKYFPNWKINWKTNRNDCDYIYLQKNLAELSGSSYQKKRN